MASKSAANGVALDTNVVTIYDPATSGKCAAYQVTNLSTSASQALINVAGLHVAGEYYGILPGQVATFADGLKNVGVITAKATSTATINHAIVRKSYR